MTKINDYTKSRELFKRALNVIPTGVYGHQGPSNCCAIPVSAFPMFMDHGKGSHMWDVDGNEYIDYMCAYGPNVLGYCDEDVDKAAMEQIAKCDCITTPSYKVLEFAELMVDTVDMADWAFFAKNGNDVTSLACLVAKAATGRKKILMFKGCYHGVSPWTQKLGYAGIVEEDVANSMYVHWNDIDELERTIKEHKDEIAGLIATPYLMPTWVNSEMPAEGYWQKVRELCTANGIVLIVDDIRNGFRLDTHGSDKFFGIKADLMCFCKALANGYNVSCLCGINDLKAAVSDVFWTGSYWMSAVPFAAGIACVNKLRKINGAKLMQEQGEKVFGKEGLQRVAKENGFTLTVTGAMSMPYIRLENDPSTVLHQQWTAEMVKRGIMIHNHHNLFVNCSLTDADVTKTLEIADEAYKVVKQNNKL
ncbi:MAG: aminotransferase class III-fold pyridoxal phosphate-dependent enzyme [Eubacteriales bacterium]|nr:aminotransferase class III-fold pyridoxal phosphate-dependent enzyme [Eubacteriales bacterium]